MLLASVNLWADPILTPTKLLDWLAGRLTRAPNPEFMFIPFLRIDAGWISDRRADSRTDPTPILGAGAAEQVPCPSLHELSGPLELNQLFGFAILAGL